MPLSIRQRVETFGAAAAAGRSAERASAEDFHRQSAYANLSAVVSGGGCLPEAARQREAHPGLRAACGLGCREHEALLEEVFEPWWDHRLPQEALMDSCSMSKRRYELSFIAAISRGRVLYRCCAKVPVARHWPHRLGGSEHEEQVEGGRASRLRRGGSRGERPLAAARGREGCLGPALAARVVAAARRLGRLSLRAPLEAWAGPLDGDIVTSSVKVASARSAFWAYSTGWTWASRRKPYCGLCGTPHPGAVRNSTYAPGRLDWPLSLQSPSEVAAVGAAAASLWGARGLLPCLAARPLTPAAPPLRRAPASPGAPASALAAGSPRGAPRSGGPPGAPGARVRRHAQGDIRNPETGKNLFEGSVKSYNEQKGFGFISSEQVKKLFNGRDAFLHKDQAAGLRQGDRVVFAIEMNRNNQPQAREVQKQDLAAPVDLTEEIEDAWAAAAAEGAWEAAEAAAEATTEATSVAAEDLAEDLPERAAEAEKLAAAAVKTAPAAAKPEAPVREVPLTAEEKAAEKSQADRIGLDALFVRSVAEARKNKEQLELFMSSPTAFQSTEYAKKASELAKASKIVETYDELLEVAEEIEDTAEIVSAGGEMAELAQEELAGLYERRNALKETLQVSMLPKDPRDEASSALLEIRPGAGGDEASLWAEDLMGMYKKFCELEGLECKVVSFNRKEGGGLSDVSLAIKGDEVYSKLKYEAGTHRVQRVPATEAAGRIHTSTATVVLMPEVESGDVLEDFNEKDIEFQFVRAGGKGGQNVNKVNTACHATHIPSGIHVFCREERSQLMNKASAIRYIKARLMNAALEERDKAYSNLRSAQMGTGDRSEKVRSYNYKENRVSEHVQKFRAGPVLAGQIAVGSGAAPPRGTAQEARCLHEGAAAAVALGRL
ncbi:unnamed protein product [Prorocentrum cordatum]|uniref:CSD domain-containing protein n=1 Tax=Prorocentrum cordatum TaxID=2364126 RepID=A0ABN9YCA3_9DINO|nr:unnamed protein product [Polarella glacialis]